MQNQCSLRPKSVLHCTGCALKLDQLEVQSIPWFNHLLYLGASYSHIDNLKVLPPIFYIFCSYSSFSPFSYGFVGFYLGFCALGYFWALLELWRPSFGRSKPDFGLLGPLWGHFWEALEPSWDALEPSWDALGTLVNLLH